MGVDHVKSTVTKQRWAFDLGSIWLQIERKVEVPGVLVVQPRYCLQPDVSRKVGRLYAVEVLIVIDDAPANQRLDAIVAAAAFGP